MFISRVIVTFQLVMILVATPVAAQTLKPQPPTFPANQDLLPNDPSVAPLPRRPQPTEAFPRAEVRSDELRSEDLPDEKELVSILKRRLPAANETVEVKDAPEWFQTMMQRIVRENVPDKYVQDKDWGKTDRRWDGVELKRRGTLRWSTKRKWKEVNHGSWKRYEITQLDPHQNLTMRIENVRDGGSGKVAFDVRLQSKLHVFGRTAKWAKGVQVYNVSADADAAVELQIQCEVGMKLDIRKFPPDVILAPSVTRADLDVTDFRLQKVSKLKGPLVRELSGSVHKLLMDKLEEKRDRLPEKINRQIDKNKDKMRLSLSDFATSKWGALTSSGDEQQASAAESTPAKTTRSQAASSRTAAKSSTRMQTSVTPLNSPQNTVAPSSTLPVGIAPSNKRVELLDLTPSGA